MPTNEEVRQRVTALVEVMGELQRDGKTFRCKPEDCPLKLAEGHRDLSQVLWGTGCWGWTCGFCGEEFEE